MTFIPEKKDAIYVRGVVIACGMPDDQGDIAPDKEGIKRIFTNYLKQESDVQHSYISNFNVHQLENTITTAPMQINGQDVPVGSWIASHMVLNPSIVAMIRANNLTGYSLGAIGDAGLNENIEFENNFLNKSSLLYKDLRDYEELNPFFISFVDKASNGFTWEVMDYTQFLSKSSNKSFDENITGDMMEDKQNDEEMVKVSVVERLLGPLLSKASETETAETEEEEEEVEDAETENEDEKLEKESKAETGISNDVIMAKLDELPSLVANGVVEAMKQLANETAPKPEEENLEKSSNEDEEEDVEDENLEKASENPETETEEEEVEEETKLEKSSEQSENVETEKMQKSSNKLDEMTKPNPTPKKRFLGGERRDEYGRVRKYV